MEGLTGLYRNRLEAFKVLRDVDIKLLSAGKRLSLHHTPAEGEVIGSRGRFNPIQGVYLEVFVAKIPQL